MSNEYIAGPVLSVLRYPMGLGRTQQSITDQRSHNQHNNGCNKPESSRMDELLPRQADACSFLELLRVAAFFCSN